MSLRQKLTPNQKFALICAAIAVSLIAETALLVVLSRPKPQSAPLAAKNPLSQPIPTPIPTRAPEVFVAPGVLPPIAAPQNSRNEPLLPDARPKTLNFAPKTAKPNAKIDPKIAAAKAFFDAGTVALKANDAKTALAAFQKVVPLAPNDAATRMNLALLYLARKEPKRAVPHLQRAVELEPKNPRAHFQLANALLATGKVAPALVSLRKTVQIAPRERAARALLAQMLEASKRPREAFPHWVWLANADKRDVGAHLQAATLANDVLKKPREAEKWLRRAIANNPRQSEPSLLLARLFLGQKRWKDANATLTKAAKARPDAFEIYPLLADARAASGDTKGAVSALESAILRAPIGKNPPEKAVAANVEAGLQIALGRLLGNAKNPKKARTAFARAAKLLPRESEPLSLGALAEIQLKNTKGAVVLLEKSLQLNPKRGADRLLLAQVFADAKDWTKADAQMAIHLKNAPRDAEAVLLRAQIAHEAKQPRRELEFLTQLSFLAPKEPRVWAQLASAQLANGQKNAALGSLQTLVKLDPKSADARFELASLQSDLGENDLAFANFQKVLSARPDAVPAVQKLLVSAEKANQSVAARAFLAKLLAGKPENLRALSEILGFYEKRQQTDDAKAFLTDLVKRDPKAKAAKNALDSFAAVKLQATPKP